MSTGAIPPARERVVDHPLAGLVLRRLGAGDRVARHLTRAEDIALAPVGAATRRQARQQDRAGGIARHEDAGRGVGHVLGVVGTSFSVNTAGTLLLGWTLRLAAVSWSTRAAGSSRCPGAGPWPSTPSERPVGRRSTHGAEVHARRLPDLVQHLLGIGDAGDGHRNLVLPRGLHLRAGHAEPVDPKVQDVDRLVQIGLRHMRTLGRVATATPPARSKPTRGDHFAAKTAANEPKEIARTTITLIRRFRRCWRSALPPDFGLTPLQPPRRAHPCG